MTVLKLSLMLFPALVIWAGIKDATSYTIPNWISATLALAFVPLAILLGLSLSQIGLALLVAFAVLLVGILLFALRWIGGGDAKLLAACALWLGPSALLIFLLTTALIGGGLALGLLALRNPLLIPLAQCLPAWTKRLLTPGGDVPYGVAIAAAALIAFEQSPLIQQLQNPVIG
jgi:prepilin peptidase CpaA